MTLPSWTFTLHEGHFEHIFVTCGLFTTVLTSLLCIARSCAPPSAHSSPSIKASTSSVGVRKPHLGEALEISVPDDMLIPPFAAPPDVTSRANLALGLQPSCICAPCNLDAVQPRGCRSAPPSPGHARHSEDQVWVNAFFYGFWMNRSDVPADMQYSVLQQTPPILPASLRGGAGVAEGLSSAPATTRGKTDTTPFNGLSLTRVPTSCAFQMVALGGLDDGAGGSR
uniref:Uncharacterized protein n=1 Tax=Haptolina ericina TaxID=156174 RepID=A0A7S3F396_9EUKA|mmetsp:Transcript_46776/g.105480  ORF Transcript_46776/g.105480 Transcript_46776/m.105480 type:complete len:226 (+) Transcript_46776:52-729(+)